MNINYIEAHKPVVPHRKRVAAYARVSSAKDASLHSLSAQISYYSALIRNNSEWEYAGVYADEGLTGTKENRPEFQRLVEDCKNGKIDMVIMKTLSRFARNTVTTLRFLRELKSLGVDVWFEEDNIHSMGSEGELLITLLASKAQEESLSASENQKWKIRKNFSEGIPTASRMLGYLLVGDTYEIIPDEAETVRMIFDWYLSGMGYNAIVKRLSEMNIPTKMGLAWHESTIHKMLKNEKYAGDLLLQKTYRLDHISKKCVQNKGELPQYRVEDAHQAIISRDVFNRVQAEMARRAKKYGGRTATTDRYEFTEKIICEQCGKKYRRKKLSSGKVVWICATFNSLGKSHCPSQQIPEDILKNLVGDMDYQEIRIPCPNTVKIVLPDGQTLTRTWQHISRSESWTPEMRAKAGERKRQWQKNQ